ncbi:MAG: hypothetical protein B6I28_02160 [Fusobacteriia bacterium 4572_132]|nr:MAG: hypothetical protein B6I28_02160 [Fusobacteriia bacterium 4572_132]
MEKLILIIGIFISIFSLLLILFSKDKKKTNILNNNEISNELELEYRDLKNQILDLTREFNRTANFNTNLLDEKTAYLNEIREDIDEKIMKINKLLTDSEILCRRLEKEKTKGITKTQKETNQKIIKLKPQKKEKRNLINNDMVFEYFQNGLSLSEIAEKTDKSVGEIEFIIGLRKLR